MAIPPASRASCRTRQPEPPEPPEAAASSAHPRAPFQLAVALFMTPRQARAVLHGTQVVAARRGEAVVSSGVLCLRLAEFPGRVREAAVGAALGAAVGAAVGAAQAGVHGRAVVAGQPRQRAQQPQRSWSGARVAPATPRVVAGRREAVARELQRLPSACLGRERGPGREPATFPPVPKLLLRVLPVSRRDPSPRPRRALSDTAAPRAADILRQGSETLPPGSLDTPPRRRRDTHTMGHPDDGLFVRTDLLPTAGASHAEDNTTKTHAAGYVPPRHATPGGQKIMQYEYQEFVNAREAAKKERRPKGAAPVLPPKKETKEGKKPPPPYVNDPTSYYTADQLLCVDGCICDKVRVVLDERTGEPQTRLSERRDAGVRRHDEHEAERRPAQIQNVLAQGGAVPLRPVRRSGRSAKVLNMSSTPTSGRRLFCRRKGRSARIIPKIKRCVLRDDFRAHSRGRARRAVHAAAGGLFMCVCVGRARF